MRKIVFIVALGALGLSVNTSVATTVSPINHVTQNTMKDYCRAIGGSHYSNTRGGYGCTSKGSKTTKECGSHGKCVHIIWGPPVPGNNGKGVQGIVGGGNAGMNERGPAIRFKQTNATASDRRVTTRPSDLGGRLDARISR